ncbi:hypothetical protein B0A55_08788 [Friedmanniomyces simplex]|uniref:Autophagy-related protein n=1 Tax=Friedmanniomyces simplex TaxID=329884 RepID=A0A4U0WVB4_9PEZI|nr:hypothetical protein B0A55_08788 [Friedmanniomyces simplex]
MSMTDMTMSMPTSTTIAMSSMAASATPDSSMSGTDGGMMGASEMMMEFYFLQALLQIANSVANVVFRVLFAEMFPCGDEVQYDGFQLAISLATVWIPQIVNAPVVNASNKFRIPGVVSRKQAQAQGEASAAE